MKKTFRSILAGAVALLAVSCYDDLALREEISKLDERVTAIESTLNAEVGGINSLASRLTAVEEGLASNAADLEELLGNFDALEDEVEAMLLRLDAVDGDVDGIIENFAAAVKELKAADKSLADEDFKIAQELAKIAVVNVAEVAGKVVLTLADGSLVEVSKPLTNADNNGLVTVVKTEEGEFWAVVKDGAAESLGIPVGHPDYEFEFAVAENGELQYSINGGEPVSTGVSTSDISGQKYIITDIVENDDNVVIKIGDASYTLPKYVPGAELSLSRDSFYVGYGMSKTVTVSGAENFYVAAKPDGWKVSVEGNVLTVTAPSKAAAELGVIETEGEIVVHADAAGCAYASMSVEAGEAFSIDVDTATGMVTFFNSLSIEYPDYTGMGAPTYDFGDAIVGILPISDFQYFENVDELIESAEYGYIPTGYLANIKSNNELGGQYVAGEYEEDQFSISISDLGKSFWPSANIEEGVHYVVWAVPQTDKVLKELYTFAYYKPIKISAEPKSVSFNDITVSLSCSGGTAYYANVYPADMFEYMTMKEFLETGYMGVGPWKQFQQIGEGAIMGTEVENGTDVTLSSLQYGDPLTPNTKYFMYVFPIQDGKAPADYVYETDLEPYIYEFTTTGLEAGAEQAVLTLDPATDYSSIHVAVDVPEGTSAYYMFFDLGDADDMSDPDLVTYLMSYCYYPLEADDVVSQTYLSGGDKKELVVATVTADGKYAIARNVFNSMSYPYNPAITATMESATLNEETGEYTVVFNVTGATKFVAWNYYSDSSSAFAGNVLKNGATNGYATYKWADVVEGKATIVVKPSSTTYKYLVYSAYNVADGAVSDLMETASVKLFE